VKALLVQIGSAPALAVLATEPYKSLPKVKPLGPPPPPPGAPPLQCVDLPRPIDRNACIGMQLQAARADHKRAFERCQAVVIADLRDQFAAAESTFQALLPARCDAQAAEPGDDKSLRTFVRSRCLIQALDDNTRGMLAANPECAQ
jgi:hypothetical protein